MYNLISNAARTIAAVLFMLAVSAGFNSQAHAARIVLKISHFMPGSYFLQKDFLEPWARELERRTRGRVKVVIYNKSSQFGNIKRQADQVSEGVIDIALGHRGFPKGRYKRMSIIEMPFLVGGAAAGSLALWQMYKEGLIAEDFKGFKVISLYVHDGGEFHTAIKPIVKPEDLKGLSMRTSSPAVSAMLRYLGAKPKGMSPAVIYENLDKAAIDGLVTGWPLIGIANLNDLIKYHTDARAYTLSFFVLMNQQKYNSLPADIRAVIDDMSGATLAPKYGPWFAKASKKAIDDAIARGNTIIPMSEAKRDEWRDHLKPMIEAYLTKLEGEGVTNARQIYARAQQLVKYYEHRLRLGNIKAPMNKATPNKATSVAARRQ